MMRQVLGVLGGLALAACASVTPGPSDGLQVDTMPQGALVLTSHGLSCTTPCALPISPTDIFTVNVSRRGYVNQKFQVANSCPSSISLTLRSEAETPHNDLSRIAPVPTGCPRRR
jgi:hypothetical protein